MVTAAISLPAASVSPDVAIWPHMLPDSWTAEATASLEPLRPYTPPTSVQQALEIAMETLGWNAVPPNFMPFTSHRPSGAQSLHLLTSFPFLCIPRLRL